MKRTVGELLFEGYADTIMEIADSLDEDEDDFDFDDEEQEKVKMDKFGWFYQVGLTLLKVFIFLCSQYN